MKVKVQYKQTIYKTETIEVNNDAIVKTIQELPKISTIDAWIMADGVENAIREHLKTQNHPAENISLLSIYNNINEPIYESWEE